MAHINPIKSKPLSQEGRDNYDRIFRRFGSPKWLPSPEELDQYANEEEQAWHDKQGDRAREIYNELAQKHADESA